MPDDDVESDVEDGEEEQEEEDLIGYYIGERNTSQERHGKGWALLPNGDQYDGDYRRGQRHGVGLYVFKNGARYLGGYRCGRKSGDGVFYYPDGSKYEGSWRKDVKHGCGIYTYPNGDVYNGNWYKGQRHGVGIYMYKSGDACFKGTWRNGVRVGPAEVHFPKHKFHGCWDYFHPQGPGVFSFDCKYILSGYYKSKMPEETGEGLENIEEEAFGEEAAGEEESPENEMQKYNIMKLMKMKTIPPSVWHSQNMIPYDYSLLPQQPVPLPISDSEESTCDLSREPSIAVMPPEIDEGEEEAEMSLKESPRAESEECAFDL